MTGKHDKRTYVRKVGALLLASAALAIMLTIALPGLAAIVLAQPPAPEFAVDDAQLPTSPISAAYGALVYEENCAPCHGIEGMGDGPSASGLTSPPAAFADPELLWEQSPAQLFHVTKYGRMEKMMPPWENELSDTAIWLAAAYAWSLHTDAAETAFGGEIYADQCAVCHGDSGWGDGPDATQDTTAMADPAYAALVSQDDWLAGWLEAHPELDDGLSQDDQRAALEFIRSFTIVPPWDDSSLTGIITGKVTAGTQGSQLPVDLEVTLDAFVDFEPVSTLTAPIDASGAYTFTKLALTPAEDGRGLIYITSVIAEDVRYTGPMLILSAEEPAATSDITVYETTNDSSGITYDRVHWIVEHVPGALIIFQVLDISNASDRTYIGEGTDEAGITRTVAMHVPDGAVELSFENGQLGERFNQSGDRVYDSTPVTPGSGTRRITMQYALPYDGEDISINQAFDYPVSQLSLLVENLDDLEVDAPALSLGESQVFEDREYGVWESSDLPAEPVTIQLSGLLRVDDVDPRPSEAGAVSTISAATPQTEPWMAWLVGLLATVSLAGVGAWTWLSGRNKGDEAADALVEQRDSLLHEIAHLDDVHALGEFEDDAWAIERAQLKNQILAVESVLAQNSETHNG